MRLLGILFAVTLVGCANRTPYQPQAMSYYEVKSITLDDARDCPRIDTIINNMEEQLRLKGFAGMNPEDLKTEEDRKYNSRARVVIWSLRIGCNNPNRYK